MIKYDRIWETMRERNISEYAFIEKHGFSSGTFHRLRHNKPITTTTIDDFCKILNCNVEDIMEYVAEDM